MSKDPWSLMCLYGRIADCETNSGDEEAWASLSQQEQEHTERAYGEMWMTNEAMENGVPVITIEQAWELGAK